MASMLKTLWTLFFFVIWPDLLSAELSSDLIFTPAGEVHTPFENESFFISCSARPGSNAVRFSWYHPIDGPIVDSRGRVHVETSLQTRGMDLIFEKVKTSDKGNYSCSATFGGKEITRIFELKVYKHINFVNTPDIQDAQEGTEALVRCEVEAEPPAQITWKFKDKVTTEPKYIINPEGLLIQNVTKADAGKYLCRAFQMALSNFKEKIIDVKVLYKPEWNHGQPDNIYSYTGGTVNLSCAANGEPTPTYKWEHEDMEVEEDLDKMIIEEEGKSILQIAVNDETDFGYYRCTASNSIGSIHRTLVLNEGAKPGIPNISIRLPHQDKIELDIIGPNSENLEVMSYKVEYRMEDQEWKEATIKEFRIDDPFVVDELQHNTVYVIRVAAKNAAGFGDYSQEMKQRTKAHAVSEPTTSGSRVRGGGREAISLLALGFALSVLGL